MFESFCIGAEMCNSLVMMSVKDAGGCSIKRGFIILGRSLSLLTEYYKIYVSESHPFGERLGLSDDE